MKATLVLVQWTLFAIQIAALIVMYRGSRNELVYDIGMFTAFPILILGYLLDTKDGGMDG